jgi:hypothetical protein
MKKCHSLAIMDDESGSHKRGEDDDVLELLVISIF